MLLIRCSRLSNSIFKRIVLIGPRLLILEPFSTMFTSGLKIFGKIEWKLLLMRVLPKSHQRSLSKCKAQSMARLLIMDSHFLLSRKILLLDKSCWSTNTKKTRSKLKRCLTSMWTNWVKLTPNGLLMKFLNSTKEFQASTFAIRMTLRDNANVKLTPPQSIESVTFSQSFSRTSTASPFLKNGSSKRVSLSFSRSRSLSRDRLASMRLS
jgi:hypothetical protein